MAVGVRIVDDLAPAGDGMPVMDVPVFVGFAARGPLDRPVALDSAAAFTAAFGGLLDLVQAGDDPSERLVAHLAPAVAAFFAGGGRRCHVIRVAGEGASSASFLVPGLRLATRVEGGWQLAPTDLMLKAGSPGAWADRLELAARLRSQALQPGAAITRGEFLRARRPGGKAPLSPAWARVERDDVFGAPDALPLDWRRCDGSVARFDPADWLIERVQVDLALRSPGAGLQHLDACGLAPGAEALPWFAPDANTAYDLGLAFDDWPLCGDSPQPSADWMLLPTGLGEDFSAWSPAQPGPGDTLTRNGLAGFHAGFFLDPAWHPGLRGRQLMNWADELRFFGSQPRRLRGLHGALGRDDACAEEGSWLLVPDAVHPGWLRTAPRNKH